MNVATDKFDPPKVAIWTEGDDLNMLKQAWSAEVWEAKTASMREAMSLMWTQPGSMSMLPFGSNQPSAIIGLEVGKIEGHEPWMLGFKQHKKRADCAALGPIGQAQFLLNGHAPMIWVVSPAEKFLALGLSLDSVNTFLESPKAAEFLEKHSVVTTCPPRSLLWLPAGSLAHAVYYDKQKDAKTDDDIGFVAQIPVFKGEVATLASSSVKRALSELNAPTLSAKRMKMWTMRASAYNAVWQEES